MSKGSYDAGAQGAHAVSRPPARTRLPRQLGIMPMSLMPSISEDDGSGAVERGVTRARRSASASSVVRQRPRGGSIGRSDYLSLDRLEDMHMVHSPVAASSSPKATTAALLRKAVVLYTRAVAANAKKEGTSAPTAESVRKLISITTTPAVAVQLLRRAQSLYTRLFGDRHPSNAAVLKVMGCILVRSGDRAAKQAAMVCFEQAASLCAEKFGPKHPVTMDVYYNIALLNSQNGRHAEASMGFARVLASYEASHGPDAAPTRYIRSKLRRSRECYRQGRYTDAFSRGLEALQEGQASQALRAFIECLELRPRDPQSAYSICCSYCTMGQANPALEWFTRALEWGFQDAMCVVNDEEIDIIRALPAFWDAAEAALHIVRPATAPRSSPSDVGMGGEDAPSEAGDGEKTSAAATVDDTTAAAVQRGVVDEDGDEDMAARASVPAAAGASPMSPGWSVAATAGDAGTPREPERGAGAGAGAGAGSGEHNPTHSAGHVASPPVQRVLRAPIISPLTGGKLAAMCARGDDSVASARTATADA